MENYKIILISICVVAIMWSLHKTKKEGFLPPGSHTGTWTDWDDYAKNYGNTRAYWGNVAPGGGWEGSPYSPENNPSGVMFINTQNVSSSNVKNTNLAKASDEELDYLYKSEIMK